MNTPKNPRVLELSGAVGTPGVQKRRSALNMSILPPTSPAQQNNTTVSI